MLMTAVAILVALISVDVKLLPAYLANRVKEGMSRQAVYEIIGPPHVTSNGGDEHYSVWLTKSMTIHYDSNGVVDCVTW